MSSSSGAGSRGYTFSGGSATYADLVAHCEAVAAETDLDVEVRQTDDEAEMIGWWEDDCPVTTSVPSEDVKATVYKHPSGEVLVAVGNFGGNSTQVELVVKGPL